MKKPTTNLWLAFFMQDIDILMIARQTRSNYNLIKDNSEQKKEQGQVIYADDYL